MSKPRKIEIYYDNGKTYDSGIIRRDSGSVLNVLADCFHYEFEEYCDQYGPEFEEMHGRTWSDASELIRFAREDGECFTTYLSDDHIETDILSGDDQ